MYCVLRARFLKQQFLNLRKRCTCSMLVCVCHGFSIAAPYTCLSGDCCMLLLVLLSCFSFSALRSRLSAPPARASFALLRSEDTQIPPGIVREHDLEQSSSLQVHANRARVKQMVQERDKRTQRVCV